MKGERGREAYITAKRKDPVCRENMQSVVKQQKGTRESA